jgi:hypothetical protein
VIPSCTTYYILYNTEEQEGYGDRVLVKLRLTSRDILHSETTNVTAPNYLQFAQVQIAQIEGKMSERA